MYLQLPSISGGRSSIRNLRTRHAVVTGTRLTRNNNNNYYNYNYNKIKKETEKILKYEDLIPEIQRMWNVKTKVTPVVIGATGTISKSFRKYLNSIPGKHEVKELEKTAVLVTACILRKVLL
jgi:hypothetical protein